MIGYIILVLVFLGLVVACFIPALLEYFRPKDAGPLKIDMNRNIDERYFSQSFRRMIERAVSLPDSRPNSAKTQPVVFHGVPARRIAADINRGPEEIVEVKGNLSVPANTELAEVLVVRGSLTTGQNCVFKKEILVEGGAKIGARNHLLCLSADFVNLGCSYYYRSYCLCCCRCCRAYCHHSIRPCRRLSPTASSPSSPQLAPAPETSAPSYS